MQDSPGRWVVEFAGIVERSSRLPNFDGIRRKLRDAERYDEGHDLIRLADALVNTGFEVEFEPALPKSVPDLGVTRGNERFFIEVSDLQRSHIAKKAQDTGLWFTTTAMPHTAGVVHAGHIYKQLSARHMKELGQILAAAAQTARNEDRLCEAIVDGAIEFAFAPENKQAELAAWAKSRRLELNSMSGPPIPSDLVSRVKGKIGNEQKQLPADTPNVIVITSYQNFIFPVELRRVISEIEEEVYEHPHVVLASLHTHWGDKEETGSARFGDHLVSVRPGVFNFTCSVILSNRFLELKRGKTYFLAQ